MNRSIAGLAALVLSGGLAPGGLAYAEALQIEPGEWEIRSSVRMPMMTEARTEVTRDCMTEPEISPDIFMRETGPCTITNVVATGSRLRWDIECTGVQGPMTGYAELTSTGETMEGQMTMSMDFQGRKLDLERTWEGERLGPCQ